MKIKVPYFMFFLLAFMLIGCSNDKEVTINNYTIEQARENGDIIVRTNGEEAENLEKFAQFQQHVDQKEEDSIEIAFFEESGTHVKSSLSTNNGEITFINNYQGFHNAKIGTFNCSYLTVKRGFVTVELCESESGEQINHLPVFEFSVRRMQQLNIHF